LGPFSGGLVASLFGPRLVFLMTSLVLTANLVWVVRAIKRTD
jgi:hypothetical protein